MLDNAAASRRETIRQDVLVKERAMRLLWQLDETPARLRQDCLYAILDAARDPLIYPGLRRLAKTDQVLPLYQGAAATELAAVAPYIVCLGTTNRVFDWIWEQGWGESWGIFVWSLVSPETLRAHFRRLTMVRTEDGRRLLFRFYDPRVLSVFLQACCSSQIHDLFRSVGFFLSEASEGANIEEFAQSDGVLKRRLLELRSP
jgi:hypothetical protein